MVIWQKHACVMTHDDTIAGIAQYKEGQDPVSRAAAKDAEKRLNAAQKTIDTVRKAQEKKNAVAAIKEIEMARIAALSPFERSQEKAAKKVAQELNKQNKKQAKDKALADAQSLLAGNI